MMRKILFSILSLLTVAVGGSAAAADKTSEGNNAQRVIAHRGYWDTEGSAQNSIAALQKAHQLGIYGSEFDVHITRDGQVVVFHDDEVDGITIEDAQYADISGKRLANGEPIPTLGQYLEAATTLEGTKLILEIKEHKQPADEDRCVEAVLATVRSAGMEGRVEYISFSKHVCDVMVKAAPGAPVSYLNGDLTPGEAKAEGYTGIDYEDAVYAAHPGWIAEAQRLGLVVNVWTVNDLEAIRSFFNQGIDFVTTNRPAEARDLEL